MDLPELEVIEETGTPEFAYDYEGVCNNEFLVKFTGYLSGMYEKIMTPQEFKTVLFCSNELLQNIGFYSVVRDAGEKSLAAGIGKFSLHGNAEKITVSSENAVTREQADKISKKLESYNRLNPEELKALYKQKLKEQSPEDSKGGGIGFIEIIRKTKNPVVCFLKTIDGSLFLNLTITVWRKAHHE